MRLTQRLNKPEYLYRPRQLFRRLTQVVLPEPQAADVVLPWGLGMRVRPHEDHGRSLWRLGIYDLVLSEAIWRLLDRGESAIDAGANIGYVTALMAGRLGPQGKVLAFEPHPKIFAELLSNIHGWASRPIASIKPFLLALSSNTGTAYLEEPRDFDRNCGTSRVMANGAACLRVNTTRLDDVCSEYGNVDFLKLDVEGHELEVLLGGQGVLESRRVRDLIFEDHSRSFNSPVVSLLESFGYAIFMLTRTFRGPLLAAKGERCPIVPYLPPNFLATREPERALAMFDASGWQVLR
jgi:FkbM family methyltransferase